MSIITDEMVEKAARAMFKECRGDCYPFEKVSDNRKPYWRAASRAALSAVIGDVVEECAKVADRARKDWVMADGQEAFVCEEIAERIRLYIPKDAPHA